MSSVLCRYYGVFESLAAGAPTDVQEKRQRRAAFAADQTKRLLDFANFIPLPRVPRHSASGT